jgi:hypothetical protein
VDVNNYLIIRKDKKADVWVDDTASIKEYREDPKGIYV